MEPKILDVKLDPEITVTSTQSGLFIRKVHADDKGYQVTWLTHNIYDVHFNDILDILERTEKTGCPLHEYKFLNKEPIKAFTIDHAIELIAKRDELEKALYDDHEWLCNQFVVEHFLASK
jgi:hypothetical protein